MRWMRVCYLTLSAVAQLSLVQPASALIPENLEPLVDKYVAEARERYVIPGMTVSIVAGDQVLLSKGYGFADLEAQRKVDPATTLFQIGSVSKTITAVAVMQQLDAGLLDVDRDVNDYLPFSIRPTFSEPLTLRALLSQRAGFEDSAMSGFLFRSPAPVPSLSDYLANNVPERVFPPGQVSSYSNYGVALAGYLVALVSGSDFERYMQRNVFQPLGMYATTFKEPMNQQGLFTLEPARAQDIALGYHKNDAGEPTPEPFIHISHIAPSGSVLSTASDMALFMMAVLNNHELDGVRILSPSASNAIFQRLYDDRPLATDLAHLMFDGRFNGYRVLGHSGGTTNFKSSMMLYPELKLGVFVSLNSDDGGSLTADSLHKKIVTEFFPDKSEVATSAEARGNHERYTGTYQAATRSYTKVDMLVQAGEGTVEIDQQGRLLVTRNGRQGVFVEIEDGLLKRVDGELLDGIKLPVDYLYAGFDEHGDISSLSLPVADIHKISWLETRGFLMLVVFVSLLFALAFLVLMLATRKRAAAWSPGERVTRRIGAVFAATIVLTIALLVRLAFESISPTDLIANWPGRLTPVLYAVIAVAITGALYIPAALKFGLGSERSRGERGFYLSFALVAVALIVVLNHWHLIGLKY